VGINSSFFSAARLLDTTFGQRQHPELDDLAIIRPGLTCIPGLIAGRSQLRFEVKNDRLSRDPLGKFVKQKIR